MNSMIYEGKSLSARYWHPWRCLWACSLYNIVGISTPEFYLGGLFHACKLTIQHCGQLLRGTDQRAGHDRPVPCLSGPEHDQRRCHWLRDRNQRQSFLSPWRRRQKNGRHCRNPRIFSVCDPRNPDDCDQHRCYARIPSDVHPG